MEVEEGEEDWGRRLLLPFLPPAAGGREEEEEEEEEGGEAGSREGGRGAATWWGADLPPVCPARCRNSPPDQWVPRCPRHNLVPFAFSGGSLPYPLCLSASPMSWAL